MKCNYCEQPAQHRIWVSEHNGTPVGIFDTCETHTSRPMHNYPKAVLSIRPVNRENLTCTCTSIFCTHGFGEKPAGMFTGPEGPLCVSCAHTHAATVAVRTVW